MKNKDGSGGSDSVVGLLLLFLNACYGGGV